jgi:hypothetical protein
MKKAGEQRLFRIFAFVYAFSLIHWVPGCLPANCAQMSSFPDAEGFGALSSGGRAGRIIKVTNLKSQGPGSLQAACEAAGPRIIIFEVGGVIRGDVVIKHSQITIAGQTAPEPGITLEGRLLSRPASPTRLHDIIVRFIRIRPRPAIGVGGDVVQLSNTERVLLDHLSLSWGNDEIIDIYRSSEVTIQWCTIEESDIKGHTKRAFHNFGMISASSCSGNISIHHNLFAHHSRRSPSLTPDVVGKPGDFRNNVVYNFRQGLTHDGHVPAAGINLIGNYYKRGPNSKKIAPFLLHPKGRYYITGNFVDEVGFIDTESGWRNNLPSWLSLTNAKTRLDVPIIVEKVTGHTAQDAYKLVLDQAGCFPRDRVTNRTISEVRKGTGRWGRNAPAKPSDDWFLKGLKERHPQVDSDGDGMPDTWEDANQLNKFDPGDHTRLSASGFSAIEIYINEKARFLVKDSVSR